VQLIVAPAASAQVVTPVSLRPAARVETAYTNNKIEPKASGISCLRIGLTVDIWTPSAGISNDYGDGDLWSGSLFYGVQLKVPFGWRSKRGA